MIARLELRAVSKYYDSDKPILNGIHHTFFQGTSYAITGASGSGKSTLLHILSLLEQPSSGSVLYNNQETAWFSTDQKSVYLQNVVGIVLQNPHLLPDITLEENIVLPGLISGMSWSECIVRARELLTMVMLEPLAHYYPWQVSGGQQQRAALARALFHKPTFILADEPTGNLDAQTGSSIIQLLLEHQTLHGSGLIISTHDQTLVNQMDITCVIAQGNMTVDSKRQHLQGTQSNRNLHEYKR